MGKNEKAVSPLPQLSGAGTIPYESYKVLLELEKVMERYQIIYADPPWEYNDKQSYNGTSTLGASSHYPTMNLDDICNLGIFLRSLMADDCVLFLWATSPLLPEAIQVIKDWGFKYKTLAFCWSKETINGIKIANMGKWTMGNVEFCLLGVRGKPQRSAKNVKQLVEALREGHSKKPDEVRERIVELMGDVLRLELFAREKAPGWDAIGFEIDGKDIRIALIEKLVELEG